LSSERKPRNKSLSLVEEGLESLARAFSDEEEAQPKPPSITIAVDAMGSDRAPKPEIEGAIQAARHGYARVILVGREDKLRHELEHHPSYQHLPIEFVYATEVIGMHEKAAQAVRSKRDSSMRVGLRLVREGRAQGFVTAGNTGAAMATAKMVLGALPGVDRPALAAVFPTAASTAAIMIDVGANVDSKPHNLEQFAVMGEIYSRSVFNITRPRVGLLSIGEEESKGNELTRQTFGLLKQLPLNFVGNVEGRDLYNGKLDVIVCDGFVGNVALKISEGLVETVRYLLKESLNATISSQVGYLLSRRAFADFKKRLDYTEYGGAPLLGIKGVTIVTHGSSNANAIKNAVRVAAEFVATGVNQKIEQELAKHHSENGQRPEDATDAIGAEV
jgi:glycerol-3-phosphate acyltransferase PlsX